MGRRQKTPSARQIFAERGQARWADVKADSDLPLHRFVWKSATRTTRSLAFKRRLTTALAYLAAWFAVSMIVYYIKGAQALQVYDCDSESLAFVTLDLTQAAECPDARTAFQSPDSILAQLIQMDSATPVMAHRCRVTYSKQTTRCGFNGITYSTEWPAWKKEVEVTPGECRAAISKGTLNILGQTYKITPGTAGRHHSFSHGGWTANGNCITGDSFSSEGRTFWHSVEELFIDIEVTGVRGQANLETGSVTFANGLKARLNDEVLRDVYEGTLVWDAYVPDCSSMLSEIYAGPAEIRLKTNATGRLGAIVTVADETTGQYAGLVIKEEAEKVCGSWCHGTETNGIAVCILESGVDARVHHGFRGHFKQNTVDGATQRGYLHLTTNLQMYQRFEEIQQDLCEIGRRTVHGRLQALAEGNGRYSLLDLFGPGHVVYRAAAVAYVGKCSPVEVTRAEFPNCTHEIPVVHDNVTKFADPFTRVLQTYPSILPCSPIMPVRWVISGTWYCATPDIYLCEEPVRLESGTRAYPVVDFTRGIGGSLFTRRQRVQHREYTETQMAREAVLGDLTNKETRNGRYRSPEAGRLAGALALSEIDELRMSIASSVSPWFYIAGDGAVWVVAIYVLVVFFQAIVDVLIRAIYLYRLRGCGCWMVWAVWSAGFALFQLPGVLIKEAVDKVRRPLADGDDVAERRPLNEHGGLGFDDLRRRVEELDDDDLEAANGYRRGRGPGPDGHGAFAPPPYNGQATPPCGGQRTPPADHPFRVPRNLRDCQGWPHSAAGGNRYDDEPIVAPLPIVAPPQQGGGDRCDGALAPRIGPLRPHGPQAAQPGAVGPEEEAAPVAAPRLESFRPRAAQPGATAPPREEPMLQVGRATTPGGGEVVISFRK